MSELVAAPPVAETWLTSPCVGICQMDRATGWCGGCGRSEKELAGWRDMAAFAQRAVWMDLPRRKAILGLGYRLLPWTGPLLLDRLAEWSAVPGAAWQIGVQGAMAEFAANDDQASVAIQEGGLVLGTAGGRAAIRLATGLRAFELVGEKGRAVRVVLALHRARLRTPAAAGLTCLGLDAEALLPANRNSALFDLGLDRRSLQFCLRTDQPALIDLLDAHRGEDPMQVPALRELLVRGDVERVAISPLGRIEVEGPGLRNAPGGPQAHLSADLLRTGRDLEPGLEIPPDYVACAQLVSGHTEAEGTCPL
ncbi:DUF1289 domain-containing protein [Geminicoccus roseus]|uniref:DUF1289 domain-containing protein n=1 Tax=Geminicoccus roseus TaxID=404900 RepID=UPI00040D1BF6|nr:DUF1289 domain-containing protein [Geminicoccus roseus]